MNIQNRKTAFVEAFLELENEEIISQFEHLLKKKSIQKLDVISNMKPMSLSEFNDRIDQSEADLENGKFKTTAELESKYS